MYKQTISLREINNIKFHWAYEILWVLHSKHEPLQVIQTIRVISNPDVKFSCTFLSNLVNVSTFKINVKVDVLKHR